MARSGETGPTAELFRQPKTAPIHPQFIRSSFSAVYFSTPQ